MNFSPSAFRSLSEGQLPKLRKKSRSAALAGGVILDGLFMAVCGLGLGIVLVVISVLAARI